MLNDGSLGGRRGPKWAPITKLKMNIRNPYNKCLPKSNLCSFFSMNRDDFFQVVPVVLGFSLLRNREMPKRSIWKRSVTSWRLMAIYV